MVNLCTARGCICLGTIKGLCYYHSDAEPKDWPGLTEQLKKNVAVLSAIKWAESEGRYQDYKRMNESLTRLIEEHVELLPLENETAMVWAYRARAWLSRKIRPERYSDAVRKLKMATDKSKLKARGV